MARRWPGPSPNASHAKLVEDSVKATSREAERTTSHPDSGTTLVAACASVTGHHSIAAIAEPAAAYNTTPRRPAPASGKVTAEKFGSILKAINIIGDLLAGGDSAQFPMPCPTRCAGSRR
jgi:fumarate hydratase class II